MTGALVWDKRGAFEAALKLGLSYADGAWEDRMLRGYYDAHRHPELSMQERRTTKKILERLHGIGIRNSRLLEAHHPKNHQQTSSAILYSFGRNNGRNVCVTSDNDALPVDEKTGLPYASEYPGKSHACGHDAHTWMHVGTTELMWPLHQAGLLPGMYVGLHRPGEEEAVAGQFAIQDTFKAENVGAVFALHMQPALETGVVGTFAPYMNAGCYKVWIKVTGVPGHGSRPKVPGAPDNWFAVDPAKVLCEVYLEVEKQIMGLNGNLRNPDERHVVITLPQINTQSEKCNVIGSTAEAEGTFRYFDDHYRDLAFTLFKRIEEEYSVGDVKVEIEYELAARPLVNSQQLVDVAMLAGKFVPGLSVLKSNGLGSDDVAEFCPEYDVDYSFCGCTKPGTKMKPEGDLHGQLLVDPASLKYGAKYQFFQALAYMYDVTRDDLVKWGYAA